MAEVDLTNNSATKAAGDLLGKKYGPLPFGVWLLIAGGAAYVTRRMIKGQEAANTADSTPESAYVLDSSGNKYPSVYTGTGGGVPSPFGSGSLGSASVSGSTITAPTEISNEPWLRRATEKLGQAGMWDYVSIQKALQTYISGGKLDQKQSAIVQQAIKMEGVPPINVTPGDGSGGNPSLSTPTGIYRPAGNAGQFVGWSDGTLTWIRDPAELQSLKTAYPTLNFTPIIRPIADPMWRNADVYQSRSKEYLASEAEAKKNWQEKSFGPSSGTIYSLN